MKEDHDFDDLIFPKENSVEVDDHVRFIILGQARDMLDDSIDELISGTMSDESSRFDIDVVIKLLNMANGNADE